MKETKKQIKAQLINEIAAKYSTRIKELESERNRAIDSWNRLVEKNSQLQAENLKLKEQFEKYEDWNRRLQEFMNMSPEEREKHFAELQTRNKLNEKMTSFMNMFQHLGLYI